MLLRFHQTRVPGVRDQPPAEFPPEQARFAESSCDRQPEQRTTGRAAIAVPESWDPGAVEDGLYQDVVYPLFGAGRRQPQATDTTGGPTELGTGLCHQCRLVSLTPRPVSPATSFTHDW